MSETQIRSLKDGIEAEAESCDFEVTAFEVFDDASITVRLKRKHEWEEDGTKSD